MFKKHRYKSGTTRSLLYWQAEWFKRFVKTWIHIFYRPAYHNWKLNQRIRTIASIDRREFDHGELPLEALDDRQF